MDKNKLEELLKPLKRNSERRRWIYKLIDEGDYFNAVDHLMELNETGISSWNDIAKKVREVMPQNPAWIEECNDWIFEQAKDFAQDTFDNLISPLEGMDLKNPQDALEWINSQPEVQRLQKAHLGWYYALIDSLMTEFYEFDRSSGQWRYSNEMD